MSQCILAQNIFISKTYRFKILQIYKSQTILNYDIRKLKFQIRWEIFYFSQILSIMKDNHLLQNMQWDTFQFFLNSISASFIYELLSRIFQINILPNRILSGQRIISFITCQYYNKLLFFKQGKMATQIQVYEDFPSIHSNLSQISTQSDQEILNFCRHRCFQNSQNIRSSNNNKIKSSLCKNFAQTGGCPYGDKCQFAHGTHELRCNAQVNVSYKTKYCNSFLNKKCCIYGFRCNFIHKSNVPVDEQQKWKKIYSNHRETIRGSSGNEKSRLLTILGSNTL